MWTIKVKLGGWAVQIRRISVFVYSFPPPSPPLIEAADNVYFHLTYEGAVDMSVVRDEVELKALETQINEFGQVGWGGSNPRTGGWRDTDLAGGLAMGKDCSC